MDIVGELITEQAVGALFASGMGLLGFLCGIFLKRAKKAKDEDTAIKAGLVALLRTHIIQECDKCTERGYVHIYNLENVNDMYEVYHSLGGNGTITGMVEGLNRMKRQ